MTSRQLCQAAEKQTSIPVREHHLRYAIESGRVDCPQDRRGGWRRYSGHHLDQLVDYVRNHSRVGLQLEETAS